MSRPMKAADLRTALDAINGAARAARPVYRDYCRAEQYPRPISLGHTSSVPARIYSVGDLTSWVRDVGRNIADVLGNDAPAAVRALLTFGADADAADGAAADKARLLRHQPPPATRRRSNTPPAGSLDARLFSAIFGQSK